MTRRISSAVLASAAILALGSFLATRGSAGDCTLNPKVQNGKKLFYGEFAKDKTDPRVCANCHGDPHLPCDPKNPPGLKFKESFVCSSCPYPNDPMGRGLNHALAAEDKKMLNDYVLSQMPNMWADLGKATAISISGVQEFQAMFNNLGINTPEAFNDVAAYLACADPVRYNFHGKLVHGARQSSPFPLEQAFVISSEYNPPADQQSGVKITVFGLDDPTDDLGYNVKGLLGGRYHVSMLPDPFIFIPLTDSPKCISPMCPPPSGSLFLSWDAIPGCTFAGNTMPDPLNFEETEINPDTVGGANGDLAVSCDSVLPWVLCDPLIKLLSQGIRELPKPGPPPEKIKPFHEFQQLTRQFMSRGLIPTDVGNRFIRETQAIIDQINKQAPIRSLR